MSGYRAMKMPVFSAIKNMTPEEFADLQRACDFNRVRSEWHRLGRKLIRVKAVLVNKPGR